MGTALYLAIWSSFQLESGKRGLSRNSSIPGYLVFVPAGEWEEGAEQEQLYTWLSVTCSSWRVGRGGRVGTALYLAICSSFQLERGKSGKSRNSSIPGYLFLVPAGEGEEWEQLYTWLSGLHSSWKVGREGRVETTLVAPPV